MFKKKYWMLDSGNIASLSNARLRLGKGKKHPQNPLFEEEFFSHPPKGWEVRYDNGYPNVFYDPLAKLYRCYYTTFIHDEDAASTPLEERRTKHYQPMESRVTGLCYAFSEDGLSWIKPDLGKVEFEGSRKNNILFAYAHGTSVFLDEAQTDPVKRYKLITRSDALDKVAVSFSDNGVDWCDLIPWPENNPAADTHNFAFRDPKTGRFVFITRNWSDGLRVVSRSESEDFIHWSNPVEVTRGVGFQDQIYSMPVLAYEGIYLGFPSIYRGGDMDAPDYDCVDCQLSYSTDTLHWNRVCFGESFIQRTEGSYPGSYDSGCIYTSIPVVTEEELRFYYMGGNGQHTNYRETSLNLYTLPKDRFAGYAPCDCSKSAVLDMKAVDAGETVYVTAEIEPGGSVTVLLRQEDGSFREVGRLTASCADLPFPLPGGTAKIRLRFVLDGATVYSFAV